MITRRFFLTKDWTHDYMRAGIPQQKTIPAWTELDMSGGDDEGALCYQMGDREGLYPLKLPYDLIHYKTYETKLVEEGPFEPPRGIFMSIVTEEEC